MTQVTVATSVASYPTHFAYATVVQPGDSHDTDAAALDSVALPRLGPDNLREVVASDRP